MTLQGATMIRKLAAIATTIILTGCAGMADSLSSFSGLGVVTVENSTFDNAKLVTVTPTFLYENPSNMVPIRTKLGAR